MVGVHHHGARLAARTSTVTSVLVHGLGALGTGKSYWKANTHSLKTILRNARVSGRPLHEKGTRAEHTDNKQRPYWCAQMTVRQCLDEPVNAVSTSFGGVGGARSFKEECGTGGICIICRGNQYK